MKKNVFLITLFLIVFFTNLLILTACKGDQTELMEQYGYENAYDVTVKGDSLYLEPQTISYYISPTIQGDYRIIAEYAVTMANMLTSNIKITITECCDSDFVFSVVTSDPKYPSVNAINYRIYKPSTGEIVSSNIEFVSDYLGGKSLNYKKQVALHEMLHTFGIGHAEADEMIGYTVMIVPHPEQERYQVTNYSDFDKANIVWKYGA